MGQAWESPQFAIPGLAASADCTGKQYRLAKMTGDNVVTFAAAAGDVCVGVFQNAPDDGQAAEVMHSGVSKIKLAAALTAGTEIMPDSAGEALAVTATNRAVGVLIVGGADTGIGAVLLYSGPGGEMEA